MADEAVTTTTETSAPTETATETAATNEAATSALGDAGTTAAPGEADQATEAAVAAEVEKQEGDGDGADAAKPEVPESYDLTAPEGFTLDAKHVEAATPVFKELGLSNEQANKLMPVAADFAKSIADGIQAQQLADVTAWRKERFEEARNDPEVGGAKWDESIALSAKALDQFGAPKGSPFRNWLDETGLGNHVEFVRMFTKIGRAVGEDTFTRADAGAPVKDTATVLYPNDTPKAGA